MIIVDDLKWRAAGHTSDTKSTESPQVCEEENADLNRVGKPVR